MSVDPFKLTIGDVVRIDGRYLVVSDIVNDLVCFENGTCARMDGGKHSAFWLKVEPVMSLEDILARFE